jgi:hypothetical protein
MLRTGLALVGATAALAVCLLTGAEPVLAAYSPTTAPFKTNDTGFTTFLKAPPVPIPVPTGTPPPTSPPTIPGTSAGDYSDAENVETRARVASRWLPALSLLSNIPLATTAFLTGWSIGSGIYLKFIAPSALAPAGTNIDGPNGAVSPE